MELKPDAAAKLKQIFANAAVGDFSTQIEIPENEDEETVELYAGINIMIDVIKRQLAREESINKAKSEFVALVSHQLRTPLSVIKWSTEHLEISDLSSLDAEARKDIDHITREADRMILLINLILDVSRIELGTLTIEPKPFDYVEGAKAAVAQLSTRAIAKGIMIEESYPEPSVVALADPTLLNVIIENLLSNAIKYTPHGGRVTLTAGRSASRIRIEVADNGFGIAPAEQDKIFTKLFRTGAARRADPEGSGLGLYIVKSIVAESGGDIWFTSEEGKGTSFFVEFPREGMHSRVGNTRMAR
jgi:two-component system phosphate regulon sensor histidine kinase PhoR